MRRRRRRRRRVHCSFTSVTVTTGKARVKKPHTYIYPTPPLHLPPAVKPTADSSSYTFFSCRSYVCTALGLCIAQHRQRPRHKPWFFTAPYLHHAGKFPCRWKSSAPHRGHRYLLHHRPIPLRGPHRGSAIQICRCWNRRAN